MLGQRDEPTDAVEEYCRLLAGALQPKNISLEVLRLGWRELGWRASLQELRAQVAGRKIDWFLLQYTALSWSRRGFPLRALRVIDTIQNTGAKCAVVFHDMQPYEGNRMVDIVRRAVQLHTMRSALKMAEVAVFTVRPENLAWVPRNVPRAVAIPVGANLPSPEEVWAQPKTGVDRVPTVAVFSFTDGSARPSELEVIASALRYARKALPDLQVELLGRNSVASGQALKEKLAGDDIAITVHGVVPAAEVVRILGGADVLLFVRNEISARRSSAIAGIACGLPVIGYRGPETAAPITEAGVVLLAPQSPTQFGPALLQVLTDAAYRGQLAERSRAAHQQYFSWPAIAKRYAEELEKSDH